MNVTHETRKDSDLELPIPPAGMEATVMRAQISESMFGDAAEPRPLIGRYELGEMIGSGGMGVVYAGWDPKLERSVAIKVLNAGGSASDTRRERMVREAQALAKLSHPNVVQVYEVGEHEDQVFVAMERIDGMSLAQWQQAGPRTNTDIWAHYRQGALGLIAAHEAGLVHRDFKPANVLVGNDGRVRVVDFGLAAGPGLSSDSKTPSSRPSNDRALSSSLTRTGTAVGTPAYMAPEQVRGHKADAASDQFSFCMSLTEAFASNRPYTVDQLRRSPAEIPAPAMGDVPWILTRTLRRGLQVESNARWPSMQALVDAIDRRALWGHRIKLLALPAIAIAGASVWYAVESADPCSKLPTSLAESWNESRSEAIGAAFEQTQVPFATDVWSTARTKADEYATRWAGARAQVCEAAPQPDTQKSLACLEGEAARFAAFVDEFESMPRDNLTTAHRLLTMLRDPTTCEEPTVAMTPPPRSLMNAIASAEAAVAAARYATALPQLDELTSEASLRGRPALSLVWRLRGESLRELGQPDEAEAAFSTAMWVAPDPHTKATSTVAWLQELSEQERWSSVQDGVGLLEPLLLDDGGDDEIRADVLDILGEVALLGKGDVPRAIELHQDALALRAKGSRSHAATRTKLANALSASQEIKQLESARDEYEQLLESHAQTVGTNHPAYAAIVFNLGVLAADMGELEEALQLVARAELIENEVLPPTSLRRITMAVMHGSLLLRSGDIEGALAKARWAWEHAQSLPENGINRIAALRLAASAEMEAEHYEEALALYEQVAQTPDGGPDPTVHQTLAWLSCQLEDFKACAQAVTMARATLAEIEGMPQPMRELLELYFRTIDVLIELGHGRPHEALAIVEDIETAAATLQIPADDDMLQHQLAKLQPELDQLRERASSD